MFFIGHDTTLAYNNIHDPSPLCEATVARYETVLFLCFFNIMIFNKGASTYSEITKLYILIPDN